MFGVIFLSVVKMNGVIFPLDLHVVEPGNDVNHVPGILIIWDALTQLVVGIEQSIAEVTVLLGEPKVIFVVVYRIVVVTHLMKYLELTIALLW